MENDLTWPDIKSHVISASVDIDFMSQMVKESHLILGLKCSISNPKNTESLLCREHNDEIFTMKHTNYIFVNTQSFFPTIIKQILEKLQLATLKVQIWTKIHGTNHFFFLSNSSLLEPSPMQHQVNELDVKRT